VDAGVRAFGPGGAGGHALCLPIAPDQPEGIAASVVAAGAQADLVLVVAGSSTGRDDRTAAVLGAVGVIAVHGVAMRPGPAVLAQLTGRPPVSVIGVPVIQPLLNGSSPPSLCPCCVGFFRSTSPPPEG
jgi:hypothetical protein